jgi:hypothetical protein
MPGSFYNKFFCDLQKPGKMKKRKKVKRVFVDLEYKDAKDLVRTLDRLKDDILSGIEKQTITHKYIVGEMECSHKQWYVLSNHSYKEIAERERTIFVVKSNM